MTDHETMLVYSRAATTYAEGHAKTKNTDQEEDYTAFCALMPTGGSVLDLGCGPGHWAARFVHDGYDVEAMDASPEMAAHARDQFELKVTVNAFEDLNAEARYDGIWANFSLLHAPKSIFPSHLERVKKALKPQGALSIGMKLGSGEARDELGRFYAYYTPDELKQHLEPLGFDVLRIRTGNGHGLTGAEETFVVLTAQIRN